MLNISHYKKREYILFTLILTFSLVLITITSKNILIEIKNFLYNFIYPFQNRFNSLLQFFNSFWRSIDEINSLKQELYKTYDKIQKLEGIAYEIEELKRENLRMRELLDIKKNIKYSTIICEIISRDIINFYNTIIVNKGSSDGIKLNMPVICYQDNEKSVVGKVIEVSLNSSKIATIFDESFHIACMFKESRYSGIVKGQGGKSNYLMMRYVDRKAIVNFGDLVVTSGEGGLFPKGLPVGRVIGIKESAYGMFYPAIIIQPNVNLSKLDTVFVLKSE